MPMRRITSLLLLVIFVLLAGTGLFMTFGRGGGPRPTVARTAGEEPGNRAGTPSRSKSFFPKGLHEWTGYAMVVLMPLHLELNGRLLLGYFGLGKRKDS